MTCRRKQKEKIVKTKNWLLTIGVATLTTMTMNALADGGPYLSPRAAGNQIKHVAGTNNDPNLVNTTGIVFLSPRAAGNQLTAATSTPNDVNPAAVCAKTMTGSPKDIQKCIESGTMSGCSSNVMVAPLK